MVVHCKQHISHEKKQVRWKCACHEFQQNEPQNQQKIETLKNNKVAAFPKTMELPGDK